MKTSSNHCRDVKRQLTKPAPRKPRNQHQIERDAERFWAPFEEIENPDWLVGAY